MINGDEVEGFWNRIWYFPQCFIAGSKGSCKTTMIKIVDLATLKDEAIIGSPPRRLSNMFWASIDWQVLTRELGRSVELLDLGCGKGNYGHRFKRLLKENFSSYTGIDIYKDEKFPDEFSHICVGAEDAHKYIENCNVIVSQSALEHIEFDVEVLNSVTEKLAASNKPFIQLHLVPASLSLCLYLWHGWRQYSKKNLGYIGDLLTTNHKVKVRIIPLGGWSSFFCHLRYITLPSFIYPFFGLKHKERWNIEGDKVSNIIEAAVKADRIGNENAPSFWALVVGSEEINLDMIFLTRSS